MKLIKEHSNDLYNSYEAIVQSCKMSMLTIAKDSIINGFYSFSKFGTMKMFLVFILELLIEKMVKENVFHFEHSNKSYSIKLELKPIIKKKPKETKRYELIPLYNPEKYITPN